MLKELLTSLFVRCPQDLAALGYRYAAVACMARARRCAAAWAPHQQNSRQAIIDMLPAVPAGTDTAVIFGSGPCLDVPVDALMQRFRRLMLVDVAHPPSARRLARRHAGVELVTAELTGTAGFLRRPTGTRPPHPHAEIGLDWPSVGLVVSLNLISQLPLVPLRRAHRHWPSLDLGPFARAIIQAHLDHLRRFRCPAWVIGDVERRVLDGQGRVTEMEDPLYGVALPPGQEWDWTVAPVGELSGGWSIINRVRSVRVDRP
ncbi:hypothetical protein [Niveispirillum irakense]|uniref:hypothetical protein n=1 Tax=Niveispirillum irakense TaxID=34011 RepID=UPI00041A0C74|nr:hypothetical protein [Niveispirillum irakense]